MMLGVQLHGSEIRPRTIHDNEFATWLYGDWNEQKVRQFEFLHNLPVVGDYMDYLLDYRADQEYLNRYGMDWTDIHDPRKLHSSASGSSVIRSSYNFVSSNVKRLYG